MICDIERLHFYKHTIRLSWFTLISPKFWAILKYASQLPFPSTERLGVILPFYLGDNRLSKKKLKSDRKKVSLIAVTATCQRHRDAAPQGHRDATPKVCLDMVPYLLHGVLPSPSLLVAGPLILCWYPEVQIRLGFGLVRSFLGY